MQVFDKNFYKKCEKSLFLKDGVIRVFATWGGGGGKMLCFN